MAETPSNLAFGDADLETLFVTTHNIVYRDPPGRERRGTVLRAGAIRNIRCWAWAR